MHLTNYKEQVENIISTINHAVNSHETQLTDVKAPFEPKDGIRLNFKYCNMFIHASGVLGFTPTERTYQRECPCCGALINIQR